MRPDIQETACRIFRAVSWGYLILLFAWLAAFLATGDHFGYLGMINLLAVYLFFPLPLAPLAAIICRSRSLWIGFAVGFLAFLWFWGAQFLPWRLPLSRSAQAAGSTLEVMTYNVLTNHHFADATIQTIRAENPDLVLIQELNPNLAGELQTQLASEYPYQILEPTVNATGIGIISKFPIRPVEAQMPSQWMGGPLVVALEWNGQTVTVVDFHMHPTSRLRSSAAIAGDLRIREAQAQLLADFARRSGPIILGGDANSGPLSDAYRILTSELHDVWHEAGFGLGNTFPGSTIPGSDRPHIGRWYVPPWLARIDYIFHSDDWEVVTTRVARFDGVSDHRGVIATLRLRK